MAKERITVLGAGSWGTALAILLARNGYETILWGHRSDHIQQIKAQRRNERYLRSIELPANIYPQADIAKAVDKSAIVLIAVPSSAFHETLSAISPYLTPRCAVAWATKGIDPQRGELLHVIANDILGDKFPLAVVSGPTFAMEVVRNLPTAITVASESIETAEMLAAVLHNPRFRVYTANDMIGVQVGGALKNVLAIATGVADGLGFGANTRTALVTRGLAEMIRLGTFLGGKQETFMGLAGLGDLVLTCTDDQSRNRRFGLGMGRGEAFDMIVEEIGQEIEGIAAARQVHRLAQRLAIELPISEQVYQLIYENLAPEQTVNNLLSRALRSEALL